MQFSKLIKLLTDKYALISGRASRSEFLLISLIYVSCVTVSCIIALPLGLFIAFLLLPPLFSVAVRRLHDFNVSGYWLIAIYVLCWLYVPLLVFLVPGTKGSNKYGDRARAYSQKQESKTNNKHQKEREKKRDADREPPMEHEAVMSIREAMDILGLKQNYSQLDVQIAFRDLMKRMHPDLGGSPYFAKKLNIARDLLLSRPQKAA